MRRTSREQGFTLIELLIVLGMLAAVLTAVYSVYIVQSRSSQVQDEVVEVQQNLRIAIDEMTRDIRMAGTLMPKDPTCTIPTKAPVFLPAVKAIGTGLGGNSTITLNLASASGRYARIDQQVLSSSGTQVFVVDSPDAADIFANPSPNLRARIIRASVMGIKEPAPGTYVISATNRSAVPPTIELSGLPAGKDFHRYDMIVGTSGLNWPDTVQYCVGSSSYAACQTSSCPSGQQCLVRIENGGTANVQSNIVATNITGMQFRYLLLDGTETAAPADLRLVRAVRVTLTGQTVSSNAQSGIKTRQMESVIGIRTPPSPCS